MNKIVLKGFFIVAFSIIHFNNAFAQGPDTLVLENERIIDVIDSEKPFLTPPSRNIQPPSASSFNYQSLDRYMYTDYKPRPPKIRPLEPLRKEDYNDNMIKLGFGRYITPLAQLYLNSGEDRYSNYGLEFNHLSAHNDEVEFRKFRQDYGNIYGSYQNKFNQIGGLLHVYNTQYFNYADTTAISTLDAFEDSIKMSYTHVDLTGYIKTLVNPDLPYAYNIAANIQLHQDKRDNSEFHATIKPSGSLLFTDQVSLNTDIQFTYTKADINSVSQNRTYFTLSPVLQYQNDQLLIKAGINFDSYNNDIDPESESFFGPEVELNFAVVPEELTAFAGYTGGIQYNTLYNLMADNRFLGRDVEILPSIEKLHVYGGIRGNVASRFNYSAKVFFKRIENQPIFTVPIDGAYFSTSYDSLMEVLGVHAELNFILNETTRLGAAINYNNYTLSNEDGDLPKYFHAPPLKFEAFGTYTWNDQLVVKATASFLSKTPMTQDAGEDIIYRNDLLLLNLGMDYRIVPRFSVFLNINNLLNTNYQRWHNYDERPVDILGGFSFLF